MGEPTTPALSPLQRWIALTQQLRDRGYSQMNADETVHAMVPGLWLEAAAETSRLIGPDAVGQPGMVTKGDAMALPLDYNTRAALATHAPLTLWESREQARQTVAKITQPSTPRGAPAMTAYDDITHRAQALLDQGTCATLTEAKAQVCKAQPALYQRYRAEQQAARPPGAKAQRAPDYLVSKEERDHWAIVALRKIADALQAKTPSLTRDAALWQAQQSPQGEAYAKAYKDHRRELIAACGGRL